MKCWGQTSAFRRRSGVATGGMKPHSGLLKWQNCGRTRLQGLGASPAVFMNGRSASDEMSNYDLRGVSVLSLIAQRPIITRKYWHVRAGSRTGSDTLAFDSPRVKLLSVGICLYLSVSNNSARQGFSVAVVLRPSSCRVIRSSIAAFIMLTKGCFTKTFAFRIYQGHRDQTMQRRRRKYQRTPGDSLLLQKDQIRPIDWIPMVIGGYKCIWKGIGSLKELPWNGRFFGPWWRLLVFYM